MPEEGRVQVVIHNRNFAATPDNGSAVVEMGARGEAVALLGIHYAMNQFSVTESIVFDAALSSNPEHELTIPASEALFYADKGLYGHLSQQYSESVGAAGVWAAVQVTQVIPLYGLIRPRRQILLWRYASGTQTLNFRTEIYYRPVQLSKVDLDTLNLKYGKYRRSA